MVHAFRYSRLSPIAAANVADDPSKPLILLHGGPGRIRTLQPLIKSTRSLRGCADAHRQRNSRDATTLSDNDATPIHNFRHRAPCAWQTKSPPSLRRANSRLKAQSARL